MKDNQQPISRARLAFVVVIGAMSLATMLMSAATVEVPHHPCWLPNKQLAPIVLGRDLRATLPLAIVAASLRARALEGEGE